MNKNDKFTSLQHKMDATWSTNINHDFLYTERFYCLEIIFIVAMYTIIFSHLKINNCAKDVTYGF